MTEANDSQADGYYGDDDIGSEDVDLSFLDQADEKDDDKK
jgi:hypothetical protein